MALYKYEFDEQSNDWQVTERRWGSHIEQQLFNAKGDKNPNVFYQAADTLEEAETITQGSSQREQMRVYREISQSNARELANSTEAERKAGSEQSYDDISYSLSLYLAGKADELMGPLQPREASDYYKGSKQEWDSFAKYREAVVAEVYTINQFEIPQWLSGSSSNRSDKDETPYITSSYQNYQTPPNQLPSEFEGYAERVTGNRKEIEYIEIAEQEKARVVVAAIEESDAAAERTSAATTQPKVQHDNNPFNHNPFNPSDSNQFERER